MTTPDIGRAESGGHLELEREQTTIMGANAVRACGHAKAQYRGCRAHRVRVPGAQRVAGGPLGGDRRRRDRLHQRHLVDAYDPI
jgi:hypothetical protein